jgi:hypothetical protein
MSEVNLGGDALSASSFRGGSLVEVLAAKRPAPTVSLRASIDCPVSGVTVHCVPIADMPCPGPTIAKAVAVVVDPNWLR